MRAIKILLLAAGVSAAMNEFRYSVIRADEGRPTASRPTERSDRTREREERPTASDRRERDREFAAVGGERDRNERREFRREM